jgi:hypothetical protein
MFQMRILVQTYVVGVVVEVGTFVEIGHFSQSFTNDHEGRGI